MFGWAALLMLSLSACAGSSGSSDGLTAGTPEVSSSPALTTSSPIPLDLPGGTASTKPGDCPRLESILYDTARSPDPQALARQLRMILDDAGRVQVLLTLADTSPVDLSAYNATITGQTDTQAQAFAPFDQLCALSNDPSILMVRLASRPETS